MKTFLVILLACLLVFSVTAAADKDKSGQLKFSESKLAELKELSAGIIVAHTPSFVLATWDGSKKLNCKWNYKTTVSAMAGPVTIEEFGMFFWNGKQWVFGNVTGKPYSAEDFVSWYNCNGAELVKGSTFSDSSNWSASGCLKDGKSLWYFIGTDKSGNRVKGEGVVIQLGKFKEEKN